MRTFVRMRCHDRNTGADDVSSQLGDLGVLLDGVASSGA